MALRIGNDWILTDDCQVCGPNDTVWRLGGQAVRVRDLGKSAGPSERAATDEDERLYSSVLAASQARERLSGDGEPPLP